MCRFGGLVVVMLFIRVLIVVYMVVVDVGFVSIFFFVDNYVGW